MIARFADGIRIFAIVCVAVICVFLMWMAYRVNEVLAGPGWCATAIGANNADHDSKIDVAQSCVGLLTIQLKSLATNSHILLGSLALCLVVLIVVVIAGAKLTGKFKDAELDIGRDAAAAANQVAGAAVDEATAIQEKVQ
jgi:hypothetical protein